MKYTPRLPETNVNVSPTSPVGEFAILLAGLIGIVVAVYVFLGVAVNLLAPRLPIGIEEKLAFPFLSKYEEDESLGNESDYVQNIALKISSYCVDQRYDFSLHLVNNPLVNAVAIPGGHIVIFSGLLEKVESENELAFIIAHEMGHFAHRDHLKHIGRSLVFIAISAVVLGGDSPITQILGQSLELSELAFSRQQETQADEFAVDALNCFYGHVAGASDFFSNIDPDQKEKYGLQYFSTHPLNQQRIAHIEQYARSRQFIKETRQSLPPDFMKVKAGDER